MLSKVVQTHAPGETSWWGKAMEGMFTAILHGSAVIRPCRERRDAEGGPGSWRLKSHLIRRLRASWRPWCKSMSPELIVPSGFATLGPCANQWKTVASESHLYSASVMGLSEGGVKRTIP